MWGAILLLLQSCQNAAAQCQQFCVDCDVAAELLLTVDVSSNNSSSNSSSAGQQDALKPVIGLVAQTVLQAQAGPHCSVAARVCSSKWGSREGILMCG
jgi:hypothetical protein